MMFHILSFLWKEGRIELKSAGKWANFIASCILSMMQQVLLTYLFYRSSMIVVSLRCNFCCNTSYETWKLVRKWTGSMVCCILSVMQQTLTNTFVYCSMLHSIAMECLNSVLRCLIPHSTFITTYTMLQHLNLPRYITDVSPCPNNAFCRDASCRDATS